ncbi:hypothetical protein SH580_21070 [Coraliomargarita algicola]|uniref:Serpin domain-containing protein n=1 Tax=Coraliomargarita algicola TaxID=3092156 RepID=A0ABZ0RI80_9BACT|nr:hypothetical protein [Coraliomargarita sp. J2-16]WPJ95910.1 hypothetical protein SH580_21070 [Coraliomargarita sp. J2-16]
MLAQVRYEFVFSSSDVTPVASKQSATGRQIDLARASSLEKNQPEPFELISLPLYLIARDGFFIWLMVEAGLQQAQPNR